MEEVQELKLLGVLFDPSLSFRCHIRQLAVRGNQRLGFLRKALPLLDSRSRATVYRGFIRPVLEYCSLVWMGATPSTLGLLDAVQHRALRYIGPGAYLPSLHIRRQVGALAYLYKLHCLRGPPQLTSMLPIKKHITDTHLQTRHHHRQRSNHNHQLQTDLPPTSRNNALRSFPNCVIPTWNATPPNLFDDFPTAKRLQQFKTGCCLFLLQQQRTAAVDRL